MVAVRDEIPLEDRWNVEALYKNKEDWEKSFKSFFIQQNPRWPTLQAYKGTLAKSPQNLKEFLEHLFSTERRLSMLYTYAHLKHDEDIANPEFKTLYDEIVLCAHSLAQETAWFSPELLGLPDETLNEYLASPLLKEYRFFLEKLTRVKKHTLSPESETLLALSGQALQVAHKAFSAINDADFQFGSVLDRKNKERPITHGSYGIYIREHDRLLRERAFNQYHSQYSKYQNTLCELLSGQLQNHLFNTQARHYSSCLDAALYPKNIDTSVYHSLIQAVNEKIDVLHKYMQLRKQVLKVDELHLYDIYVPLIEEVEIKMSYQEAEEIVIESVAPLGSDYQNLLKQGMKEHRWVDRYENKNKRSGAYSSGCYDSMPYILMNFKNILRDVFTLAHEAGHSMHSLYSHKNQPYQYSDYPIFLAEVASTFNEDLLMRLLLSRCQSNKEKIFLINQQIEDIRGTLFRQTMFAEFELLIHEKTEKNIPLTPQLLNQEYHRLNQKYFGPSVSIDKIIEIEWARIPHFYYNFYVFQYATGISVALALSEKVVSGDKGDRDAYLNFLKGGSSQYPIEMLKTAGIDMSTPLPVISAIQKFERLLNELESLLQKTERKEFLAIN